MLDFQDAFISYGRADSKAFVTKLYNRLLEQDLKIWFDQDDIPLGVDFQNQIDDGLQKSHNFLFVISPHAINSPYCLKEIELAIQRNKRIIPLLHVEQITQETWQQRNPDRDQAEWEAYQAKGLHSSFPNMHPVIGKINWIYFREGIDDFEQAIAGLLEVLGRHQDYVQQHTFLLMKALEWERNHKQTQYLLVDEERKAAEEWLQVRFENEQPPCIPTDLHCEFICESIKNFNNFMTHVFLSYAEGEREVMEEIARSLMREGFTIWTNKTDIKTGSDFGEVINRGIEEADNLVLLMSPNSLKSKYCQQELAYAQSYNKRIIPVLIVPLDLDLIPPDLRAIQFIDMTDQEDSPSTLEDIAKALLDNGIMPSSKRRVKHSSYQSSPSFNADIAKLIRILREDETYYEQHKILLARALKWQRQKHNPSILLRGYDLQKAETWLKSAKGRTQHLPTSLHEEFLGESLRQPPEATLNVFVCYSWIDANFSRKLNDGLQIQGQTTWFGQESMASEANFQQLRFQGIECCNNFLFIISPSSIAVSTCLEELAYAAKLNKRIVPVMYREVSPDKLPAELSTLEVVNFRNHNGDFFVNFGDLIRTLEVDPNHVQTHTQLLVKAMEWDREGRDDSFLLRGKNLADSELWLQQGSEKDPKPTTLQLQYLAESRALPFRKIRRRNVVFTTLVASVLVGAARFFGLMQPVELVAYDHLLRLRPSEGQDNRFLLVAVDSDSVEAIDRNERYRSGRGTLPDLALSDLLQALNRNQPRVIGLDFYRDIIALPELTTTFQKTPNLVAICKAGGTNERGQVEKGTKAPPNLPLEQVGFNNLVDDGVKFVRRQYLMAGADKDFCDTTDSFSLTAARKYLASAGKPYTSPYDPEKQDFTRSMQFGTTIISPLWGDGGGYRDRGDQLGGYQALLNFRTYQGDPGKFIPQVNLKDVLENRVAPELIRDRIVIIGFIDRAERQADYWNTPYGEIPGVTLQAQMMSQLVSATLDGRHLIGWMPMWSETVWLVGWSLAGSLVVWGFRRSGRLAIAGLVLMGALYGICYAALVYQSLWLPLVPGFVGMLIAGGGIGYLNYRRTK